MNKAQMQCCNSLYASVYIFVTNDVILAEILTGLHFDQVNVLGARVFQAMPGFHRYVSGFIRLEQKLLVTQATFATPLMTVQCSSPLVVHLQRQVPGLA